MSDITQRWEPMGLLVLQCFAFARAGGAAGAVGSIAGGLPVEVAVFAGALFGGGGAATTVFLGIRLRAALPSSGDDDAEAAQS